MIANLLDNALRHTPPGAAIEVSGERTPRGVSLSVADNGPGVATDELKAIFQRFYRARSAQAKPGTGLGLSLVAAIAELYGLARAALDNNGAQGHAHERRRGRLSATLASYCVSFLAACATARESSAIACLA